MESAYYIHDSSKHTRFFWFCICRTSPISVLLRSRRALAIIEKIFNNISFQTEYTIRINKPTPLRIIVPTPQIIQPRLLIKHIPAIAERLHLAQRFRQFTGTPQRRAPRIVAVAESRSATDSLDKVRIRHMEQFFLLLRRLVRGAQDATGW